MEMFLQMIAIPLSNKKVYIAFLILHFNREYRYVALYVVDKNQKF